MGGVCTGGTMKHQPEFHEKNDSGFSGKLKSVKSFGKQKKRKDGEDADDDIYSSDSYHPDLEVYEKRRTPHTFDSGELHFSVYSQLKPSTPARIAATKDESSCFIFSSWIWIWASLVSSLHEQKTSFGSPVLYPSFPSGSIVHESFEWTGM